MLKKILLAAGFVAALASSAFGQASYTGLDSTGATVTFKSINCASTICPLTVLTDVNGASIFGTAGVPNANVISVQGVASGTALPISAGSLPLPSGASTSALQTTGNTSLASIDTKTPALGQALAAGSVPVVLTAAQLTTLTPLSTVAVTQSGVWTLSANQSVNVSQINGVAPLMGNGVTGTGSQRVTIASDNTPFTVNATQSGTWNVTNISGAISLPTGASTSANQSTMITATTGSTGTTAHSCSVAGYGVLGCLGQIDDDIKGPLPTQASTVSVGGVGLFSGGTIMSATNGLYTNMLQGNAVIASGNPLFTQLTAGAAVIGAVTQSGTWNIGTVTTLPALPANQSVNVSQVNGITTLTGAGAVGTGSPRVAVGQDTTTIAGSAPGTAGTPSAQVVSVQGVASGTPLNATLTPGTTGGWSKWSTPKNNSNTPLTNTVVQVKGSAGTFGGYYISNPNTSQACLQVFDAATAGAVTLGTTRPDLVFCIPAGTGNPGAANLEIANGVNFASGIQIAWTTTASGLTAPATGSDASIFFK
jgi:hypothetical protein